MTRRGLLAAIALFHASFAVLSGCSSSDSGGVGSGGAAGAADGSAGGAGGQSGGGGAGGAAGGAGAQAGGSAGTTSTGGAGGSGQGGAAGTAGGAPGGAAGTCAPGGAGGGPGPVAHGSDLSASVVGPGAIGITTFVDIAGGYVTGKTNQPPNGVPGEWDSKGVVRIVAAGGETIDGYCFPEGTVVVQGANITSHVDIYGNNPSGDYGTGAVGVVFRGCKFRFGGYSNVLARDEAGIPIMVSYSELGAKDKTQAEAVGDAFAGNGSLGSPFVMKRNYITLVANAGEIGSHVIVDENLAEDFWSFAGDHVDGWQFGGGISDITVVRNKVRLDPPYGGTGCFSFFNDFEDYSYAEVVFDHNYIAGGGYSVYLPASTYPVSNFKARGNRWSTEYSPNCGEYGPVYPTSPMDPTANGNEWSDNRWLDGPNAGQAIDVP